MLALHDPLPELRHLVRDAVDEASQLLVAGLRLLRGVEKALQHLAPQAVRGVLAVRHARDELPGAPLPEAVARGPTAALRGDGRGQEPGLASIDALAQPAKLLGNGAGVRNACGEGRRALAGAQRPVEAVGEQGEALVLGVELGAGDVDADLVLLHPRRAVLGLAQQLLDLQVVVGQALLHPPQGDEGAVIHDVLQQGAALVDDPQLLVQQRLQVADRREHGLRADGAIPCGSCTASAEAGAGLAEGGEARARHHGQHRGLRLQHRRRARLR